MKIARMLGLFAIAVFFTSVPIFASCYSDCDEAYESCTGAANYAEVQCGNQCYSGCVNCTSQCEPLFEQCMDTTYPYGGAFSCSYIIGYWKWEESPWLWPNECFMCYINYTADCPNVCINAFQSCTYGCEDAWNGSLSQCSYSKAQCEFACCGDNTCEGSETCETCSADCGPC